MGFDLGHMINSLAKLVLRAKRVADKNKAEEQNVEEEVRKKFFEWLDWVLSSKNIDKAVAFNFNIYEDGNNIWSLEFVCTSAFSATDSDWACAELFATREHPFKITYSEPWQEVLTLFKKYVNSYLETGTLREVLKSKAGVGIGFVDGDLELLYENPTPCPSPKEPTPDKSAEERRKKFQAYFEKNLKYISQTEISVEKIERQFAKDGICRRMPLGKAHFPTGRVVVADPLAYLPSNKFSPELEIQIPKGAYPVDVSIYQSEDIGSYMCTTRLRVKDTKVVRYVCAASTKESATAANDKEAMSGFPVDAGMMTICDAKVAEEYREFLDQWYRENPGKNHYDDYFADFFAQSYEMYPSLQRKGGDFIMWINPIRHRNMPMVASGFGDGFYISYIGYDKNDEICQVIVPMVNPELFENEKESGNADKFQPFWSTMELCDWNSEGDDYKVLEPVIKYLSKQNDDVIFEFDDLMSELLYHLDTKEFADQCQKEDPQMCDDTFLYSRCVALINGRSYYEKVKQGKVKDLWNMEFEALMYVPGKAWALKHKRSVDDYPHSALFSYETGSDKDGWGKSKLTDRSFGVSVFLGQDQILRFIPGIRNKFGIYVPISQGKEIPLSSTVEAIGKAYQEIAQISLSIDGTDLDMRKATPKFKAFRGFRSQKQFNSQHQYIWSFCEDGDIRFTFMLWHNGEFAVLKSDIECKKIIPEDSDAATIGQTILDVFNMADSAYPEKHIWNM